MNYYDVKNGLLKKGALVKFKKRTPIDDGAIWCIKSIEDVTGTPGIKHPHFYKVELILVFGIYNQKTIGYTIETTAEKMLFVHQKSG